MTQILIKCPICGKEKLRYPSHAHIKTCSHKCGGLLVAKMHRIKNERKCKICSKLFVPKHNKSPGIYCSYTCASKARMKPIIMRRGYKYIKLPNHPNTTTQGYYAEHRLVMEQYLGRILDKKEVVHHINHIKADNKIENLMLFASTGKHTQACHAKRDSKGKWA